MWFLALFAFVLGVSADETFIFKNGNFEKGFEAVNPNDLVLACVNAEGKTWMGVDMLIGQYIVFTNNNTISTKVEDKDEFYKSIRFTARFQNDDFEDIPLNLKLFDKDFNVLYNYGDINGIDGYTVTVKEDKTNEISVKLDNFNINEEIATIIFTRLDSSNTQQIQLWIDDVLLDTSERETNIYENSALSVVSTILLGVILLGLF